ncbi:MAG TPA: metallophosphoesterase [Anaerolineales bacterium]|nr:metallophosphoesterase [Anaerolineales bacterium]
MRIAFTADIHLTNEQRHSSRSDALANILAQCASSRVDALIIAGDLFNSDVANPRVLENIIRQAQPLEFPIIILPGNHDPHLTTNLFTNELHLRVIELPELDREHFDIPILFIPYAPDRRLGEVLSNFKTDLVPNGFLLVSHGDLPGQIQERNTFEGGFYMPLFKRELQEFKPRQVFLGHIHSPISNGTVHYPGSPIGLDITETGIRSFIVYDTKTNEIERKTIKSNSVNYIKKILLTPGRDETDQLNRYVEGWKHDWEQTDPSTLIVLRVTIEGYSSSRGIIESNLKELLSQSTNPIQIESIDTSNLSAFNQEVLSGALEDLKRIVADLPLNDAKSLPEREQIFSEVLNLLFGGKP